MQQQSYLEKFETWRQGAFDFIADVKAQIGNLSPDRPNPSDFLRIRDALIHGIDYSESMKDTIGSIAIDSAEIILKDKSLRRMINNWNPMDGKSLRRVETIAQFAFETAIAKIQPMSVFRRKTHVPFIYSGFKTDKYGEEVITNATYQCIDSCIDFNKAALVFKVQEVIELNVHPDSTVRNPYRWLSSQFHENVHGIENAISLAGQYNYGAMLINKTVPHAHMRTIHMDKSLNDITVAMALRNSGELGNTSKTPYEIYRASPSERLARWGQHVFEKRLCA